MSSITLGTVHKDPSNPPLDIPKILVWVNCYGSWAPGLRHPVETIGYDQYLEAVTRAITSVQDRVELIYVSGGMRDAMGRTECETTVPELQRRLRERGVSHLVIKTDEGSITSMSIVKKFLQTWQAHHPKTIPLLFCDQVRYDTNAYSLEYFAKKFGYSIPPVNELLVPFPRLDNHPNSTPEKQAEKLKYLQEKGVEEVERLEIEARRNL